MNRAIALAATALTAGSVLVAPVRVDAAPGATISWVARTLKAGATVEAGTLVTTTSNGAQRWSASGACSVTGSRVRATSPGTCTLSVTIARTSTSRAVTATRKLPVMKEVTVNVLAAASLSGAFTRIANRFSTVQRHVRVVGSFAGSATLVTQIQQGAPFDVVAMADQANMTKLVASESVDSTSVRVFAMNRLAILVRRGNPLRIRTIADLANPSVSVSLCDTAQPCGKYAAQMLVAADVNVKPVTLETSAAGVVGRVATGEVDAGIAYASDGFGSRRVTAVEIPVARNVIARYPVALARGSSTTTAASLFRTFLLGSTGRSLLSSAGFIVP